MFKKLIVAAVALMASCSYGITLRNFPTDVQEVYATTPLIMIPFDSSMRQEKYAWIIARKNTEREVGVPGEWLYQFLKTRWENLSYHALRDCSTLRIPKIIHQIWIGNGVPAELKQFQASWQRMHPEW
jgi:mannosyltransferase OCH1-like enzyme